MARTRQPQGVAQIDWSHPRSNQLSLSWTGNQIAGVLPGTAGVTLTRNGSPTLAPTQDGLVSSFSGADWYTLSSNTTILPNGPFTISWLEKPVTVSNYPGIFAFGYGGTNSLLALRATNATSYNPLTIGAGSTYVTFQAHAAALQMANGVRRRFVVRCSGAPNSTTPGQWSLFCDGVAYASANTISGGPITTQAIGWDTADDKYNGHLSDILAAKRYWSDGEVADYFARPYAHYLANRRVWVQLGPAAGGPTAYPLTASPATATLTGTDVTFVYTPASTAYPLTASAGTATIVGSAATFSWGRTVTASAGTAALAGSAATFSRGYQVTASAGTYALTGAAATFAFTGLVQYALTAEPATVTVTGTTASFVYTGVQAYALTASPGTLSFVGSDATVGIVLPGIWTDVGVSAATWSDVGGASSIWTDL